MSSRITMTRQQQLLLCLEKAKNPTMRPVDLGTWAVVKFKLPQPPGRSTIRKILQRKESLLSMRSDDMGRKRSQTSTVALIDLHIIEVLALYEKRVHLPGREIIALAVLVTDLLAVPADSRPKFTRSGWLRHFLARYGLRRRRSHGEAGSVDASVVEAARKELRCKISKYHPSNVFNMDEAAYFYQLLPHFSICFEEASALKQSKARVTIVVGTNAVGTEKLPLVILGKSKKPRWLDDKPAEVEYQGTSKGWMTVVVFQEWLTNLNDKMKASNRHILLLFDNAPVHIEPETKLPSVEMQRLPKNTTAVLQPMDQGIIAWLKHETMASKTSAAVTKLLENDGDPNKASMLDAVEWLQQAWDRLDCNTIRNCWRHSGLYVDRLAVDDILN